MSLPLLDSRWDSISRILRNLASPSAALMFNRTFSGRTYWLLACTQSSFCSCLSEEKNRQCRVLWVQCGHRGGTPQRGQRGTGVYRGAKHSRHMGGESTRGPTKTGPSRSRTSPRLTSRLVTRYLQNNSCSLFMMRKTVHYHWTL